MDLPKNKNELDTQNITNVMTNTAERQKFKAELAEITHCMRRIDDEKESIKEIVDNASKKYGLKKPVVKKIASAMYKNNAQDVIAENNHFELLCETLISGLIEE